MKVRQKQRGFLLIAVLVIIMLASMVALSLIFRVRAEQASFGASVGGEQAWYAAMSGIQQAIHLAAAGGQDSSVWQNNPGALYNQFVQDDGSDRWYFTVYSTPADGETQARYGLSDEAAKVNLNKATAPMLFRAFELPSDIVHRLTGEATEPTNSMVVETNAFELVSHPQFATLDDLLLIPGVTPGMIYGEDANHNFHLDPNEDDGDAQFPPDDGDGQLFLGLQDSITVYSYEFDLNSDREPRIQLNSTQTNWTVKGLPDNSIAYMKAEQAAQRLFKSPADLLEAKDQFKDDQGKEVEMESGITAEELPAVMDLFTTIFEPRLAGLININSASIQVLKALPGVDQSKAEAIVEARDNMRAELRVSPAWLYSEKVLTADEFKAVAPFITTHSYQYRFHVIGYGMPSGRYRVFEVVIDAADKQPQITYLRDITKLGLPFPLPANNEQTAAPAKQT
jgi:DNA uptake protein ComE-like DNA-binding protein